MRRVLNRGRCRAEGFEAPPKIGNNAAHVGHDQFYVGHLIEQAALNEANSAQAGIERKPKPEKLARRCHADTIGGNGRMQMHRHPEPGDVLKNGCELGRIEQPIRDIRKDLKSTESELIDAAIDFHNRPLQVAKPYAPQRDKLARIVSNDPGQIVVNAHRPLICLPATEYFWAERDAVAQSRDIDFRVFHVAQLLLYVDDLWQRGNV